MVYNDRAGRAIEIHVFEIYNCFIKLIKTLWQTVSLSAVAKRIVIIIIMYHVRTHLVERFFSLSSDRRATTGADPVKTLYRKQRLYHRVVLLSLSWTISRRLVDPDAGDEKRPPRLSGP